MSHNAVSHNIVLKITVPRRTGRRRKKGTNDPWEGDVDVSDACLETGTGANVRSFARLDEPKVLRRKLADNVGAYDVEAIGVIKRTHRFRALADFYWDMGRSDFAQRFADQVLPGDGSYSSSQSGNHCSQANSTVCAVEKLKQFSFREGMDRPPNVDVIPPPIFTHMSLPFNYFYSQNPYVRTTEDGETVNLTAVKQVGHLIRAEDPAPQGPQISPDMTDPRTPEVLAELDKAFRERPLWTRRSLMNKLQGKLNSWNELKKYLNYAAYQFKGGPWRDSVVPYGVDPRTDPKYRIYQTLMFKLNKHEQREKGQSWQSVRRTQTGASHITPDVASDSHVFDGRTYCTDGKVWQVCDITDPLLKGLFDDAPIRPQCNVNSGWYHGGLWAKAKAIMKTKLVAIQFGRQLTEADFASTLEYGDMTPTRSASTTLHLPLPDLDLSNEELTMLRGREPPKKKSRGYNVRIRESGDSPSVATEQSPMPFEGISTVGEEENNGSESDGSGSDEDQSDNEEYPKTGYEVGADGYHAQFHAQYHGRQGDDYNDDDEDDDGMSMNEMPYPELD